MKIKMCGITNESDYKKAISIDIDYIGFVFYEKSPRYIELNKVKNFIEKYGKNGKKLVAVIVDKDIVFCKKLIDLGIDIIQFHNEFKNINFDNLDFKYWKVFSIGKKEDLEINFDMYKNADKFLFDTKSDLYGGTSESFEWNYIDDIKTNKHFFIAGGVSSKNILKLKDKNIYGVDLSSSIEIDKGIKNHMLMDKFVKDIKDLD